MSFETGVGRLREHLIRWKRRQKSDQPDYLKELETLYKSIFLGRSFVGIESMPSFESPTEEEECFVLSDGHRTYDIVEMSAGEQSIIQFLYEVVRRQIKPIGSKHGFRQRILGAREAQPNIIIAGIKDRDFDDDNSKHTNTPHEWYATVKHYLTFFAGKDLLYMMRSELKKLGFKDSPQPACYVFREHILRGIQSSPKEVWTWLPEWQRLRKLISEFIVKG
ncbi:MAG: hypothetical protein ABFS56_21875 [Pseudomonadota bacterium]